jgi:hypothetical protein
MSEPEKPPVAFISYSWTTPEYQEQILALASRLRSEGGVEVILDVWHLEEGQNAYKFMERTVNDESVDYVLVMCDSGYTGKANERTGGVGTETAIISPQVYRDAKQTKFIPVIMERDEDGHPTIPTFLDGAKFVDLSREETFEQGFETVVRRLHGRPERVPPPVGARPSYLDEDAPIRATGRTLVHYRDAVMRGHPTRRGKLGDFLGRLRGAVEELVITGPADMAEIRNAHVQAIEGFLPYRDEFVELVRAMTEFEDASEAFDRLHRFFEELANLRMESGSRGGKIRPELEREAAGFVMREMFVYAVAILLREERFDALQRLLRPYHVRIHQGTTGVLCPVGVLDPGFESLVSYRHDPFVDPLATLLRQRATLREVPFEALQEAEVLLALRSGLEERNAQVASYYGQWHVHALEWHGDVTNLPFWVRLQDRDYRGRVLTALGITSVEELRVRIESVREVKGVGGLQWMTKENLSAAFGL